MPERLSSCVVFRTWTLVVISSISCTDEDSVRWQETLTCDGEYQSNFGYRSRSFILEALESHAYHGEILVLACTVAGYQMPFCDSYVTDASKGAVHSSCNFIASFSTLPSL